MNQLITEFKNLLTGKRKSFYRFCLANNLGIIFKNNQNEFALLKSIFEDREYSDYFPFYRKATIIDIGAHYGYFSIFANKNTDNDSSIFAIEPNKSNFDRLVKNIRDSAITNIRSLNYAVSGESGTVKLHLGRSLNHSIVENYILNQNQNDDSEMIEAKTLEEIIVENKILHVDFLKMDCEGAEYSILENTPGDIFDRITTISMEFHDLKDNHFTGEHLIRILIENGFKIVKYKYERTSMDLNYGKIIATKLFDRSIPIHQHSPQPELPE
jgi:FkbM family methyltransferase